MTFFKTTRRRVIAFGAAGAAALAAGEALRWFAFGYDLHGDDPPVALSSKELVVVRAIVEALCPPDGDFPSGVALRVPYSIDEEVYSQTPELRSDMKAAIEVIEHAPPLVGVPHRLSALPPDKRAEVFQRLLQKGPDVIVQAGVALKEMTSLYAYGSEATWSAIGYDGPWVKTVVPPPSHARYAAAAAAAAAKGRRA